MCHYPPVQQQWQDASVTIHNLLKNYNLKIHHQLLKLISDATTKWRSTPHPIQPTYLDSTFTSLFQAQSQIGWDHILKGRFAKDWIPAISTTKQMTPRRWVSYTIRILWHALYNVWKSRCDVNHGTTTCTQQESFLQEITPSIALFYSDRDKIDPTDQYIFKHLQDKSLRQPSHAIKTGYRLRNCEIGIAYAE
jgi:hypothetical protein